MKLHTLAYCALLAATLSVATPHVVAQQSSQIVDIDGVKYSIHDVVRGETLYSLARMYGTTVDDIAAANPALSEGLKAGQRIKIPISTPAKQEKRKRKDFDQHVVAAGETLYSISRKYSIAVDALIADNNNIDPSQLPVGAVLYIRRSEVGQTKPTQVESQIERHAATMNSVATGDYAYHVVHTGEAAADIARRFGTTEEYLVALNNMRSAADIHRGRIIKVPKHPTITETAETAVAEEPKTDSTAVEIAPSIPLSFSKLSKDMRAKVSLLLPLGSTTRPAQNYIDFYRGFLMGADDVRRRDYSFDIDLHNTAHDHARIEQLLSSGALDTSNLVIGPVYEDELIPVVRALEPKSIPIVSPLANINNVTSNAVYRMSPATENKYDKVRGLFDGTKRVVFITTESNDVEFTEEIKALLGETPYEEHRYAFEHPSIIEQREKEREKARAAGLEVDETPSPSDMSPLLQSDRETIFIITADNEIEVDRILAAIASANISLSARSRSIAPFSILGNSRWNRYRNIDRSMLFSNRVIMLSTYHARRDDERVKEFDCRFVESFGTQPSLYAYRGYDAAMLFISALYEGFEGLSTKQTPLQTPYVFLSESGLRTNTQWVKISYNPNFTITIE